MGSDKEIPKHLQSKYGKVSLGAEHESMISFWSIEIAAAPMYNAMLDCFKIAHKKEGAGPFKKALREISRWQEEINKRWIIHVTLTNPDEWQDLQGMAHWDDGECVGVSG